MTTKQYIEFEVLERKPKTTVYVVVSKTQIEIISGVLPRKKELGVIKWNCGWRRYVFHPNDDTFWSEGCLDQVGDFIHNLMEARKK